LMVGVRSEGMFDLGDDLHSRIVQVRQAERQKQKPRIYLSFLLVPSAASPLIASPLLGAELLSCRSLVSVRSASSWFSSVYET